MINEGKGLLSREGRPRLGNVFREDLPREVLLSSHQSEEKGLKCKDPAKSRLSGSKNTDAKNPVARTGLMGLRNGKVCLART